MTCSISFCFLENGTRSGKFIVPSLGRGAVAACSGREGFVRLVISLTFDYPYLPLPQGRNQTSPAFGLLRPCWCYHQQAACVYKDFEQGKKG